MIASLSLYIAIAAAAAPAASVGHIAVSAQPALIVVSARASVDTIPFDTTQVVVADSDFAQLLTFLKATMHEWSKPLAVQMMKKHVLTYRMELGDYGTGVTVPRVFQPGQPIPIPDYAVIADSIPAVAQGLASAKMSARRYLQLSRTLNIASVTDQMDRFAHQGKPQSTETKTLIGKNVAYIRAHRTQFDELVNLGLDVISMQGGQGGQQDFNP